MRFSESDDRNYPTQDEGALVRAIRGRSPLSEGHEEEREGKGAGGEEESAEAEVRAVLRHGRRVPARLTRNVVRRDVEEESYPARTRTWNEGTKIPCVANYTTG